MNTLPHCTECGKMVEVTAQAFLHLYGYDDPPSESMMLRALTDELFLDYNLECECDDEPHLADETLDELTQLLRRISFAYGLEQDVCDPGDIATPTRP